MHKVRIYAHFLSHVYKDREGIGRYKLKTVKIEVS